MKVKLVHGGGGGGDEKVGMALLGWDSTGGNPVMIDLHTSL